MQSNKNWQQDYRSQVGQCADAARDARHDATDNEHRQNEHNSEKTKQDEWRGISEN